jgi:NTE family protein
VTVAFDGTPPNVLVLGGGGLLGEAWMTGVLAGYRDATGADPRGCRRLVGTSAGSIVAVSLAAGRAPRRPGSAGASAIRPLEDVGDEPSPFAGTERAGRRVRTCSSAPERSPPGWVHRCEDWRCMFCPTGSARSPASGTRSTAGAHGSTAACASAPWTPAADAGSCSAAARRHRLPSARRLRRHEIPAVFAPLRIGDRLYVDGGDWSPTNADAAPAGRGDRVLVLEPTAVLIGGALRGAALLEALTLRARGASVHLVTPDSAVRPLMAHLMDPDHGGRVLAAGYQQGLALGGATSSSASTAHE